MLRKFCATPSMENSTLGERPTWTPMTPTRVRSPVSPDAGNFASCTKSMPTCDAQRAGLEHVHVLGQKRPLLRARRCRERERERERREGAGKLCAA